MVLAWIEITRHQVRWAVKPLDLPRSPGSKFEARHQRATGRATVTGVVLSFWLRLSAYQVDLSGETQNASFPYVFTHRNGIGCRGLGLGVEPACPLPWPWCFLLPGCCWGPPALVSSTPPTTVGFGEALDRGGELIADSFGGVPLRQWNLRSSDVSILNPCQGHTVETISGTSPRESTRPVNTNWWECGWLHVV